MKKSIFAGVLSSILSVVLFTNCENFLTGGDFKKELETDINYAKAPIYKILVKAESGSGSVKIPATGEALQKVSDTFTVKFEPAQDCEFYYWVANIDGLKPGELVSDYIEFEDAKKTETKVTLKKADSSVQITLCPVSPVPLAYEFFPLPGVSKIHTRDSSIELTFNQPLDKSCFYVDENTTEVCPASDFITIGDGTLSASTYFKSPVIREEKEGNVTVGKVVFSIDTSSGYIPVSGSGSAVAINVKIPKERIWRSYLNNIKVGLEEDIDATYYVGSETSSKVQVTYSLKENDEGTIGSLRVNDFGVENREYSYSVGDTVSLRYNMPSEYTFNGWTFTREEGEQWKFDTEGNMISSPAVSSSEGFKIKMEASSVNENNLVVAEYKIENYMSGVINIQPDITEPVTIKLHKDNGIKTFKADKTNILQDDETKKYGVGKSVTFSCTLDEGYTFEAWKFTKVVKEVSADGGTTQEKSVELSSDDELISAFTVETDPANPGVLTLTINKFTDTVITITPVVCAPVAIKFVKPENGVQSFKAGSAAIDEDGKEIPYAIGKTVSLLCKPAENYTFSGWKFTKETITSDEEGNTQKVVEELTEDDVLIKQPESTESGASGELPVFTRETDPANPGLLNLTINKYTALVITVTPVVLPPVTVQFAESLDGIASFMAGTVQIKQEYQPVEYGVGKTVSLSCRLKDGYVFSGWKFKNGVGEYLSPDDEQFKMTLTGDENTTNITLTIDEYTEDTITVIPEFCAPVKITYANTSDGIQTFKAGSTILSQEEQSVDYAVGKSVILSCRLVDEYTFKGWKFVKKVKEVSEDDGTEQVTSVEVSTEDEEFKKIFTVETDTNNPAQITITVNEHTDDELIVTPLTVSPVSVHFENDADGTGTLKAGNLQIQEEGQTVEYAVGKEVNLTYRLPEGYGFSGWEYSRTYKNEGGTDTTVAATKDELTALGISIVYDDSGDANGYDRSARQAKAVLTVTKYTDSVVSIKPVCYQYLVLDSFNLFDGEKVYSRDSSIVLTFNRAIEDACKNKVNIKISGLPQGKTGADYFNAPELSADKKTITITAKNDNASVLIPLSGLDKTNTVTVQLSAPDFYYKKEVSEDETINITLAQNLNYTYKINSQTAKKTKMKFRTDDALQAGVYKVNGIQQDASTVEYNMGDEIQFAYTLTKNEKKNYNFTGWSISRTYEENETVKTETVTNPASVNITFTTGTGSVSDDSVYEATATIQNSVDGVITIVPVITHIPDVSITVSGDHGIPSPNGELTCKLADASSSEVNHIEFKTDSDYAFIRWQLVDSSTGQELPLVNGAYEYVNSSNLNSEKADFTVIKAPKGETSLEFRAVVAERPQIISNSPINMGLVNKDTTIQVMFDYDMDERSIYYTTEELSSLRTKLGIAAEQDSVTTGGKTNELLFVTNTTGTKKYYGYVENSKTFFKNIKITNNKTNEDITGYYAAPVFDDPSTLSIKVKRGANNSVQLVKYMQVRINLDRGFFYSKENTPVTMSGSKKWIYQVNDDTDGEGPEFTEIPVFKIGNQTIERTTAVSGISGSNITFNSLPRYLADTFNLSFTLTDTGHGESGPNSSFILEAFMEYDANYNKIEPAEYKPITVNCDVNAMDVVYNGNCDLNENNNAPSGIYAISKIIVEDKCGNRTTYPPEKDAEGNSIADDGKKWYVCLDKTGPEISSVFINRTKPVNEKTIKPEWSYSGINDYVNSVIYYSENTSLTAYDSWPSKTVSKDGDTTLTELKHGTKYKFYISSYDWFGNENVTGPLYGKTLPAKLKNVTLSAGSDGTSVTVTGEKPDEGMNTHMGVRYREKGVSGWSNRQWVGLSGSQTSASKIISGLEKGKVYEFEVCSDFDTDELDYIGLPYKTSEGAYPTFTTVPASVTLNSVSYSNAQKSLTVNYTAPSTGDYTGIKVIYSKNADFTDSTTKTIAKSSATGTYTLTGLDDGTRYYVKLEAYLGSEDNKSVSAVKSAYTMPAKVSAGSGCDLYFDEWGTDWTSVNWDNEPASGDYTGYEIWYKLTTDTAYTKIATLSPDDTCYYIGEYEDGTILTPGKSYNIKVVTYIEDTVNNVKITNDAYAPNGTNTLYPCCVNNLVVKKASDTSINVTWTNPGGYFNGYNIWYNTENKFTTATPVNNYGLSTTTTSYNITGLTSKGFYYVWVETYVGTSYDSTSRVYSCNSKPCSLGLDAVTNLKVSSSTVSSNTISWTNPTYTDGYIGIEILRKLSTQSSYTTTIVSTAKTGTSQYIAKTATSYTDTGLSANTSYDYIVRTYSTHKINDSVTITCRTETPLSNCRTQASPVTNFAATVTSPTQVSLSWTVPASANYNQIKVYYGSTLYNTYSKGTTSCNVTGLTGGTSYTFYVKTTNGNSVVSNSYPSAAVITYPSQVTNFRSIETTQTSKKIGWTNPTGNYTGVRIYYKLSTASAWTLYADYTDKTTTQCNITGLTAGTLYNFKATTYLSGKTDTSTVSDSSYDARTRPNTVTNLKTTSRTTTSLTLGWTNPVNNYDYVTIYYREKGTSSYSSAKITKGNTSYTITGLASGTAYEVYVTTTWYSTSFDSSTASSVYGSVTTPLAPTGVTSTYENGQIKIGWTVPSGNQNYYRVKYSTSSSLSGTWSNCNWISGNNTNSFLIPISTLTPGTYYYFRVISNYDADGVDIVSDLSSSYTNCYAPPPAVTNVSVVANSGTSNTATLKWTNPDVALQGVYVYINGISTYYSDSSTIASGASVSKTITLPNLSSSHKIEVKTYKNTAGAACTYNFTPVSAVSGLSVYSDDGMGTLRLKWTNPSNSSLTRAYVYVNNTYYDWWSESSGTTVYRTVTIPSFRRGTTYSITVTPYSSSTGYGNRATLSVRNDAGNLVVNGYTIDSSMLKNVITSSTSIVGDASEKVNNGVFRSGRTVTLSKYSMGAYEVTQSLFYRVMGYNPSTLNYGTNNYPVNHVTWYEAIAFCNKLSASQGLTPCYTISGISASDWTNKGVTTNANANASYYIIIPTAYNYSWNTASLNQSANGYHLPTEAQWEFAARGGSVTGTNWSYKYSGSSNYKSVGWVSDTSGGTTHVVGGKTANSLGLYDMTGNVYEWITDWNYDVPTGSVTNPWISYGLRKNDEILLKGGSYNRGDSYCTVKRNDYHHSPETLDNQYGFRICRNYTW